MIPLVNLQRQYAALKPEVDAAIARVVSRQQFINGPETRAFTAAYVKAMGATHGAACDNGTAALELALKALGVGPGDEVITVAHTFFATVEAIMNVGATPVFADINPATYCMNPQGLPLSPKTKALLPVHLYGAMADMTALMTVARQHQLQVIEDTAQAHSATLNTRIAGTIGDAGTFSFYPGKNLGAYGDAGFVVAQDAQVAATIAKLADHGRASKYGHDLVGSNLRMDEIQAAVLSVKLPHLSAWTKRRQAVAAYYDSILKPKGFKVIEPLAGSTCVYHLYVVEISNRDATLEQLNAAGIGAGVHYPIPLHKQAALKDHPAARVHLPHTESAAARVISLPMCADITDAEAETVASTFLRYAKP